MSGILDKKVKLIDLVITEEGRRQMANGGFRPTYASFSDNCIDYAHLTGSTRETINKLYFQTPPAMADDQIVFETDDGGKLLVGRNSEKFTILNDDVYVLTSSSGGGTAVEYLSVSGSQFASTIKLIKDRTIETFKRNKFIKTLSGFELDAKSFQTNIDDHTFVISNSVPFPKGPYTKSVDIDHAETFMFDSKLAHVQNFQYLPPVNVDGTSYGSYEDLRSLNKSSIEDIKSSLGINVIPEYDKFEESNTVLNYDGDLVIKNRAPNLPFDSTLISRECAQIYFKETSEFNNFIGQFFEEEKSDGTVTKLDIVDAGQFFDEIDTDRPNKHVFYVGKVLFDSNDMPTFVNIFTVILD